MPSEKDILKKVNLYKGKELTDYLASLEKLKTDDKEQVYLSAYDILHN